jgi:hypothetical protein
MTLYGYLCTGTAQPTLHVVETTPAGGARDAGCVCLPQRIFMKYVKSRYDVIEMTPTELTIENRTKPRKTLTSLPTLLAEQGCSETAIEEILAAIERISADKAAKTNKGCFGMWVSV